MSELIDTTHRDIIRRAREEAKFRPQFSGVLRVAEILDEAEEKK